MLRHIIGIRNIFDIAIMCIHSTLFDLKKIKIHSGIKNLSDKLTVVMQKIKDNLLFYGVYNIFILVHIIFQTKNHKW